MRMEFCANNKGHGLFDTTRLFESTACSGYGIAVIVLHAGFILASIISLVWPQSLFSSSRRNARSSLLLPLSKTVLAAIASGISVLEHIFKVGFYPMPNISSVLLATQSAAMLFATLLYIRQWLALGVPSKLLFWYWAALAAVTLPRLWSTISSGKSDNADFSAFFIVLSVALMMLELQTRLSTSYESLENINQPESSRDNTAQSLEDSASLFSQATFSWLTPILKRGQQKPLEMADIPNLSSKNTPKALSALFQKAWTQEMASGQPSLLRATLRTYWCDIFKRWLLSLLLDLVSFLHPVLLSHLIGFISSYNNPGSQSIRYGYYYAISIFLVAISTTFIRQQAISRGYVTNFRINASLKAAIYRKTLAMSNDSCNKYSIGEIVSRMSFDTAEISYFVGDMSYDILGHPLKILISLYMLFSLLGWSVFVGLSFTIFSIPLSSLISKRISSLGMSVMQHKDARIKVIDEMLAGIKAIKLYAWESAFIKKINFIRNELELAALKKSAIYTALINLVGQFVPFLVTFSSFAIYSLYGNSSHGPLTLRLVFVSMALFEMIKTPIVQIPHVITSLIGARIALKRLEDYLACSEVDPAAINHVYYDRESPETSIDDVMVSMQNSSFKWLLTDTEPQIKNINLQCRRDELVAIIGKVGSGKSSLASAVLGDMTKVSGNVEIRGSIAYASQQPWIINASLRDNILFGHEMDIEFYQQVIEACALGPDVGMLPAGDLTEIGEKGINLSGGQKARLSLARAVYARADIYILDDPLAAVDMHVSKHLFNNVIGPQGLLNSRARILVTNAVQYLQKADAVYMLDQGSIVEHGDYSESMNRQGHIYEFVHRYIIENKLSDSDMDLTSSSITLVSRQHDIGKARRANVLRAQNDTHEAEASSNGGLEAGQLITDEVNMQGKVRSNVYWEYINECGLQNVAIYFVALVLASTASVASNFWLKNWASKNEGLEPPASQDHYNIPSSQDSVIYYIAVYGLLGLLGAALGSLRSILQVSCSVKASESAHHSMLKGIIHSPMEYFDRTPMGRIVNRFSSDIVTVDYTIPWAMSSMLGMMFGIISSLAVIGVTAPVMILVFVPVALVYRNIQNIFISSSREITRINAAMRSPVIAHLQETIGGISSIRAYDQQQRYISDNEKYMENNVRVAYTDICTARWLSLRLESLGDFVLLGTMMFAIVMLHLFGVADAGAVGLSITYAISMTGFLGSSVSSYVSAENAMTNLERIVEYANLPAEAPPIIDDRRPAESWPAQGVVEFRDYSTKYREGLDCVLKNISFCVKPAEKVGIVGRTGAGKTSLTLALFRLIEATDGQILVDGQDISQYGLYDVRSRLSIIPQDPVLFVGTIRENVDPLGAHADLDIWQALEHAHLAEYVRSKGSGLDLEVAQGGSNLSVGQRQLVCLARALLKQAKVLVLDEATAAIDNHTDNVVQRSIREQFRGCTVLTIAHRPNTIIDSDRILVIDNGEVAEYDTPENLLADPNSLFSSIVGESNMQD